MSSQLCWMGAGARYERKCLITARFSSVQFSLSVMSNSLQLHGLQHARLPCSSPNPRAYLNSCPLTLWCHPTISSSVVPFSSCLQSFIASGSFPMSQFFKSGGQSIGVSASSSVLPMNIQDWFSLGLTGLISLQSIKKAEGLRIYVFELWYWRRLLRVPWTAKRSNQLILKETSSECSSEGLMLKLKLQ